MSYEKKTGIFKFDFNDKTVELDQYILSAYLPSHVAQDLFEVSFIHKKLSRLNLKQNNLKKNKDSEIEEKL